MSEPLGYKPIKDTFQSPEVGMADLNGRPFSIIGYIDGVNDDHDDAESLPLLRLRFEDGVEVEARPDEIFDMEGP